MQAFEEAELAKLKEEKPGLTLHQYKDLIWKLWKKSPDNPLNQVLQCHLPISLSTEYPERFKKRFHDAIWGVTVKYWITIINRDLS
jgi:hypothetical protein